jgi:predicted nucleic acid-binding protein
MNVPKIYLETTIFNYYFDNDREAHPFVLKLFEEIKKGKYLPYTSRYVIDELGKTLEPKKSLMLNLISQYDIITLDSSDKAVLLANSYISEGIIPITYFYDALHIAIATVNNLDMILSLNFKHIVRDKTRILTEDVNISFGYKKLKILNPLEVVDYENS